MPPLSANSNLTHSLSYNIVGAGALDGPVILITKSHCRKAINSDFLRKFQYLHRKYWRGVEGAAPYGLNFQRSDKLEFDLHSSAILL